MKEIQQLRRIAVKLGVSGTVTPLAETRLYKGGYGFVTLQAYVPVTQNRSPNTAPLCTVFRTTIDKFGNRKQFNNDKYNMLYVNDAEIENAKYMVFECPLPKAFTETVGELELVFTYSEVNGDNKAVSRLASGIYQMTIHDSDVSDGDTVDPVGGELARLNDITVKVEQLEDSVDALLQPPDCTDADKVGTPNVGLAVDGRLKFNELKGYDAITCSLILKSQEPPEYYRDHAAEIAVESFNRVPKAGDVFIMPFEQIDTAAYNASWRVISVTKATAACELVNFVNITEPIKDYADRLYEQIASETERAEAAEQQLGSRIAENSSGVQGLQQDVEKIESYIPSTTSEKNQLTNQAFVNSSINSMAAFYITSTAGGEAFPTRASLFNASTYYFAGQPRTPTKNDYAIVLQDETQPKSVDGTYPTTRYMFDGTQWDFQYVVNNTALTQAQVDAINSGVTKGLVTQIGENKSGLAAESMARANADASLQEQINSIGAAGVTSVNGKTGAVSVTPENIGAVDKSGDTMTGGLSIYNDYNLEQAGFKHTVIDATGLDGNTWYPVTIKLTVARKSRIIVEANFNCDTGLPSWSTHADKKLAYLIDWESNGNGWGTLTISRNIYYYRWQHGDNIFGKIDQLDHTNNEYIYVRGGAKYHFYTTKNASIPTLRTSTFTESGQSVSPTATFPAYLSNGATNFRGPVYENDKRVFSPNNPPNKTAHSMDFTCAMGIPALSKGTLYNLALIGLNGLSKDWIGGIVTIGDAVGYVISSAQFVALNDSRVGGTSGKLYYYTLS